MKERLKIFAQNLGNTAICVSDMPEGWGWKVGQMQEINTDFLWDCEHYLKDSNYYFCSCGTKANSATGLPHNFIDYWEVMTA